MKLLAFFLIFCGSVWAYENEWNLKGGLGLNFQSLIDHEQTEDELFGLAVNTSFGYRFVDFEINTASYITMGHADNLNFQVGNELDVNADSNYWAVNFLLLFKYYTNINVYKKTQLYFSLGPGIAIQTFWPTNYTVTTGDLNGSEKITYETIGIYGTIGIEEKTLFKEEFPTFLELLWGFNRSYKTSLIDVEDSKTTAIILTDDDHSNFQNFVLIINFGVTFF